MYVVSQLFSDFISFNQSIKSPVGGQGLGGDFIGSPAQMVGSVKSVEQPASSHCKSTQRHHLQQTPEYIHGH